MATLQVATTTTGVIVSDPQAVRELCESYCFGTLDWEATEDGEFTIRGYDDFEVYERGRTASRTTKAASWPTSSCENSPTTSKPTKNSISR